MKNLSVVITDANRQQLAEAMKQAVLAAPEGNVASVKPESRTAAQNRYMWPYLTCFAQQLEWPVMVNGDWKKQFMGEYDWKDFFTGSFQGDMRRMAMGMDGTGLIMLGQHTSGYSKTKFSDFIEFMHAFGAKQNVKFVEPGR